MCGKIIERYFFLFYRKKGLLSTVDLVSRVNNLVGYNLPDIYLGIIKLLIMINYN